MVKPVESSIIVRNMNNIKRIRKNAISASYALNKKSMPAENDILEYSKHLKDKMNYPTIAMLAMREQYPGRVLTAMYDRNKTYLETHVNETKILNAAAENTIKRLYPKTRSIREYIINNERIVLDFVKKSKGYNILDKLRLFFY